MVQLSNDFISSIFLVQRKFTALIIEFTELDSSYNGDELNNKRNIIFVNVTTQNMVKSKKSHLKQIKIINFANYSRKKY